jgi:hypothetical protein
VRFDPHREVAPGRHQPVDPAEPVALRKEQRDQRRGAGEEVEGGPPTREVEAGDRQAKPRQPVREQRGRAQEQAAAGRAQAGANTGAPRVACPHADRDHRGTERRGHRLDAGGQPDRVRGEGEHRDEPAGGQVAADAADRRQHERRGQCAHRGGQPGRDGRIKPIEVHHRPPGEDGCRIRRHPIG